MADTIETNPTRIGTEPLEKTPSGYTPDVAQAGSVLLDWIGSFWTEVYEDESFVKVLQEARGLRVAQLYLDFLENLAVQDRRALPVFHRERWHPIVLRRSQRNTGANGLFKLTGDGTLVFGEQTHEVYSEGMIVTLGGKKVDYRDLVAYPLTGETAGMKDVLTCLSNSITDASVILGKGTGFAIVNGTLLLPKDQDPFEGTHADAFPKFEILPDKQEETDSGDFDEETVIWACDAMFDRNFLSEHLAYALGMETESKEIYKRILNAVWDMVTSGCSPLLLKAAVAAICDVPVVKSEGETVERVIRNEGSLQVVTNKNVYTLSPYAELKKNVVVGAKLKRFDTLDKAIRVYTCANDLDRLATFNEFLSDLEDFRKDVPSMDLPPAMFRSSVEDGFSVGWAEEDVTCVGFDANGNPKLRFPLGGSEDDEDTFWQDTWANYEAAGLSMKDCLEGLDYDPDFREGEVCAKISPMRFFMQNLVGANTVVLTVRTDTLADDAPLYDPKFFDVLRGALPTDVRFYIIEHETVHEDTFSLDDNGDTADDTVLLSDGEEPRHSKMEELAELYEYDEYAEKVGHGGSRRGSMGFRDGVDTKWAATCRDTYDNE